MSTFLIQLIKNVQASLWSSLLIKQTLLIRVWWLRTRETNTEEEVKRRELSAHFLRLLLDERLGDCLLPLLRLGEGRAALMCLGGE